MPTCKSNFCGGKTISKSVEKKNFLVFSTFYKNHTNCLNQVYCTCRWGSMNTCFWRTKFRKLCFINTEMALFKKRTLFLWNERQHFLSQNNLSLRLTSLPAIFTQPKLQMIYFQLHSAAIQHMCLPIKRLEQRKENETFIKTAKLASKPLGLIHISFSGIFCCWLR